MRYKLSRVLQAIADDESSENRFDAHIAANKIQYAGYVSFEQALDACFRTIPSSVGLPAVDGMSSKRFARQSKRVHDRLVAAAVRLGVPMEEC
jgi:hypothetical protein